MSDSAMHLLKLLDAGDPRFVPEILAQSRPEVLVEVVDAWGENTFAWAASEAERYLLGIPAVPGHEVVVRRLIASADKYRRHRVLAAAMVFVDQLVVRQTRPWMMWSVADRKTLHGVVRYRLRDQIPPVLPLGKPGREARIDFWRHRSGTGRLFRLSTRQYLRRFVWRSIRGIANESPDEFIRTLSLALRRYPDAAVSPGTRLLECWCLMKALFAKQPEVKFSSRNVKLVGNASCNTLIDSTDDLPYEEFWLSDVGQFELRRMGEEAVSAFVRRWALTQLDRQRSASRVN